MARRSSNSLIFDSLLLEGGLFAPAILEKAARGEHSAQLAPDYHLPQGLSLSDEQGRAFRIASALWKNFEAVRVRHDVPATQATAGFALEFLRDALGFSDIKACSTPVELADRTFPITAFAIAERVPVVVAPYNLDLDAPDERFVVLGSGARRRSAYQLAQQFLNASADCTWAILTNGRQLRLVRDADTLTRPAFLEADLELILRDQRYADFAAVWRLFHSSRAGDSKGSYIWDTWKEEGQEQGERVRDGLRNGVTDALLALGTGFLEHPANDTLCQKLQSGELSNDAYFQQLLRLVYRCLFLFTVEERGLLHVSDDSLPARKAREAYAQGYALRRLRDRAIRRAGFDRHGDLWASLQIVFRGLATGEPRLALPALGSLFTPKQCPDLDRSKLENRALLAAMRELRWSKIGGALAAIDYRNMGPEELGSVYESLLELSPTIDLPARSFGFIGITDSGSDAGNKRKTSGSYYTSDALVQELIKAALNPLIEERIAKQAEQPATAILSISVCDPACGSGHFLLAAARRLAERLAEVRAVDGAPTPADFRHALREVTSRCIYGVDLNPMAVELCRVALWLETIDPGKPLGFLNHHIRCGNSLLGATPVLLRQGIPDDAFSAIEGDDKKYCSVFKRQNKDERKQLQLFHGSGTGELGTSVSLAESFSKLSEYPDDTPEEVEAKAAQYDLLQHAANYADKHLSADAWCAAFFWRKVPKDQGGFEFPLTNDLYWRLERDRQSVPSDILGEIQRLAQHYKFFHWHLEFPDVFGADTNGGFDCILGNPPWDALSPDQREFFSQWIGGLRSMAPEEQTQKINSILGDSQVAKKWSDHCRDLFALVHFLKDSGVYTLYAEGNLGKGDFNIYRMFVELGLRRIRNHGVAAQVVPGGLYGGANASAIRKHLLDECELSHVYGLINTKRGWFKHVDIDRFAAFAARRGGRTTRFKVKFGLTKPTDLLNESVELAADAIRTLAPDTYAIPDVRDLSQQGTSSKMSSAFPLFGTNEFGPPIRHYSREIDMGTDRDLFTIEPTGLPVFEGRMIDSFDYRAKTYASGHGNSAVWIERAFGDPAKAIVPQWRVLRENIPDKLGDRCYRYRIAFCDVANPRNQRSFTSALIPPGTICGDKVPTLDFGPTSNDWMFLPWLAVANSFAMDWLTRTRLTSPKMAFSLLDGLPFPRAARTDKTVQDLAPHVLRLVCVAPEMTDFWNRMAADGLVAPCAPNEIPSSAFIDPTERAEAQAFLDAYVAKKIFNLTLQELSDMLDTFDAYRNSDIRAYQEFRTKRLILEAWENLDGAAARARKPITAKQIQIPTPPWMDRPLVLPSSPRGALTADRYRSLVVPHLLYQAGGKVSFDRFRRAYWLLTEPATLQRFATNALGATAKGWAKAFRDNLAKDMFIPHLKAAVSRDLHFIRVDGERWLELRRTDHVADDEHATFDARLALLVADLWPASEPIPPLSSQDETTIRELELVT